MRAATRPLLMRDGTELVPMRASLILQPNGPSSRIMRPAEVTVVRRAGAPVVVGGGCGAEGGVFDRFEKLAAQCLPAEARNANQVTCELDPNGNPVPTRGGCAKDVRRVPVSAAVLRPIGAVDWTLSIPVKRRFFPVLIGIKPAVADLISIGSIQYAAINKLIGNPVSGDAFSYDNETGGYVLEGDEWLTAGESMDFSGVFDVALVAAVTLKIDVHGFTPR